MTEENAVGMMASITAIAAAMDVLLANVATLIMTLVIAGGRSQEEAVETAMGALFDSLPDAITAGRRELFEANLELIAAGLMGDGGSEAN